MQIYKEGGQVDKVRRGREINDEEEEGGILMRNEAKGVE